MAPLRKEFGPGSLVSGTTWQKSRARVDRIIGEYLLQFIEPGFDVENKFLFKGEGLAFVTGHHRPATRISRIPDR